MKNCFDQFPANVAVVLVAALASLTSVLPAPAAALKPLVLRCEYRVNPLGIDEAQPRLTWRVESTGRGQKQTAYQIVVTSDATTLWDSGKIASDQTVNIVYAGTPLVSRHMKLSDAAEAYAVYDRHEALKIVLTP